ncbi:MAG: hypothetical protein ACTS5G_01480, partial [Burkholderiales bacterium]
MRGLAEYVMSGRRQAATVAVLFGLIPMLNLLSAAVVALVALRRGPREGALIMLWALLPAGLRWLQGETASVIMLVGVLVLAQLLRRTQSWQQVLLLATVLGLLLQLSLPLQPEYLASIRNRLVTVLESGGGLQAAAEGMTVSEAADQIMTLWVDVYGVSHVAVFIACLMIGRYWQALLYNPGGFQQEFHELRMDRRVMAVLLLLVLGGLAGVQPLASWIMLFCIVPSLCGLAVVHK